MRVSTGHRSVRSTVLYAFWRSMKHMKRETPAFRRISCSLRTTNIMSVVSDLVETRTAPFKENLVPAFDTSDMPR